jgi:dihydrofolate reductase
MRKLIVTQNITVDGVVEATEGWFEPAGDGADNSDVLDALREQDKTADGFLVGRRTFVDLRGYWPKQTDDTTGITDYLNRVSKYVVSRTLEEPEWENSTILRGSPRSEVEALKAQPGMDIVTTGSIMLVRDLIAAGLVDEYRLFVYPVVVGRGRRLFADATDVPRLELLEARPFRSGIVLLTYKPV